MGNCVSCPTDRGSQLAMSETSLMMTIGGGIQMRRSQYLAGFKASSRESYPTVPALPVDAPFTIEGSIKDVADAAGEHGAELDKCLWNEVKVCAKCGKPCAWTMETCNSCGASLEGVGITKTANVFTSFLFGVQKAPQGFPLKISLRRETEDVLVFDDMLQLTPCHLNGIPKKFYIPDWRYLLLAPQSSLELLDKLEESLWEATKPFLQNEAFRKTIYRDSVTDDEIRKNVICSFNYPPSQYQMHVQWLVPPLIPFQHWQAECRNHFHEGRGFPMSYVRKLLQLNDPYDVKKETPIEEIMAYYKSKGVDYSTEWTDWYENICLKSTLSFQNWNPDDFQYVVQDGKAYNFTVADQQIVLGDVVEDAKPGDIQTADKVALQNYGRPYSSGDKPSGTYIQNPLLPKLGEPGGFGIWPPSA